MGVIQDRNDLPQYLSGIGVEIGVYRGVYSERLLRDSHLSVLFSIDPWSAELCPDLFPTPELADQCYQEACSRLLTYGSRSRILRCSGLSALEEFTPESIDFVYIDSSHAFSETLTTIERYWSKLKPNGLMAGHDYCNGVEVQQAVNFFVASFNTLNPTTPLNIEETGCDADYANFGHVNSWMIRKPS